MKKKIIGFGIFCLIIGIFLLFDFGRSKLFTISLVDVQPYPIVADGNTKVTVKALLTRGDKPVEGHELYILSLDGGIFHPYRSRTNAAGEAFFEYFPYRASHINPLRDLRFEVRNESNSVFFEVNAKNTFTLSAVESQTEVQGNFTMSDLFGD